MAAPQCFADHLMLKKTISPGKIIYNKITIIFTIVVPPIHYYYVALVIALIIGQYCISMVVQYFLAS